MAKPQKKLRVGILFGGESAEHEVSLQSAKNVLRALDKTKFEPVLIGIDKTGVWHFDTDEKRLMTGKTLEASNEEVVTLVPGNHEQRLVATQNVSAENAALDVIFPVLHGTMGEDGAVQGFLELAHMPYVGPAVLASAVCMDKDVTKRLLRDAGVGVADFAVLREGDANETKANELIARFGLPLFVKPANLGSSVGVSKVTSNAELVEGIKNALQFDIKVLVEKAIAGDEIECAVLGNDNPKASAIGRVVPRAGGFYSYEAKYISEDEAKLEIPANIAPEVAERAKEVALQTFKVLGCEGMSRVDMFAQKDGRILVNEVNTIPGFTQISMYPKLWEISGVPYGELVTELIMLAVERFERRRRLHTSYDGHI